MAMAHLSTDQTAIRRACAPCTRSTRRCLAFQLFSLIVACAMTIIIVPVFILSLRPQRVREQAPGKTRCGPSLVGATDYCQLLEDLLVTAPYEVR
jgi:hypothetical protein